VPRGGRAVGDTGTEAILWAVIGAILGGLLLNLMPCVFPILALKALHLAKSGGDEGEARRDALGYAAGAIVGTGALGVVLLAIRAGGSEAGWAFQLQDPRTILVLLLLTTAITLNLLRVFEVPAVTLSALPSNSFGTGALAAFVATPCAGPFLGAALGTALLLPPVGSVAVFAALGLGLALPFLLIAFVPWLRRRLPKPGPWMVTLQRILAIPMALTALACLWLLWRLGGSMALQIGLVRRRFCAPIDRHRRICCGACRRDEERSGRRRCNGYGCARYCGRGVARWTQQAMVRRITAPRQPSQPLAQDRSEVLVLLWDSRHR